MLHCEDSHFQWNFLSLEKTRMNTHTHTTHTHIPRTYTHNIYHIHTTYTPYTHTHTTQIYTYHTHTTHTHTTDAQTTHRHTHTDYTHTQTTHRHTQHLERGGVCRGAVEFGAGVGMLSLPCPGQSSLSLTGPSALASREARGPSRWPSAGSPRFPSPQSALADGAGLCKATGIKLGLHHQRK